MIDYWSIDWPAGRTIVRLIVLMWSIETIDWMKIHDKLAKSKAKNHLCFWPIGWLVTMMNVVKCRNLVHFHCGFSELLFSTSLLFWHLFRRQVFGLCQNQKENIFKYLHFLFLFSFFLHKFLRNNQNKSKIKKKKYLANDGWRPLFNSGLNFFLRRLQPQSYNKKWLRVFSTYQWSTYLHTSKMQTWQWLTAFKNIYLKISTLLQTLTKIRSL